MGAYSRFKANAKSSRTAAKAPVSVKKYVKKAINRNIETKEHFENSGAVAGTFDRNGLLVNFMSNNIQGDADNNRNGDVIKLMRLKLNLRIVVSGTPPDVVRIIVFRWKPLNVTAPTYADILRDYTLGTDYQNAMSHYNNKKTQYQILYNKIINMTNTGDSGIFCMYKNFKLKGIRAEFQGASNMTNGLYMILLSEGAPTNSYVYNVCVEYKDI